MIFVNKKSIQIILGLHFVSKVSVSTN